MLFTFRALKRRLKGMKPEYIEGPKARKKFERVMKALFRVPKNEVKEEIKRKINTPRKAKS